MAQGLINNGVNVTKSFSPNQLELLADYTVSGSAITSYTFSGLKINTDEEVLIVSDMAGIVSTDCRIYVNGNLTDASYYRQESNATGTTVNAGRANYPSFNYILDTDESNSNINIKLTNTGYFIWQSSGIYRYTNPANMYLYNFSGTSTFTLSQISSLTILAAGGIGIGSRFQLYKVKGQVQQTWATT